MKTISPRFVRKRFDHWVALIVCGVLCGVSSAKAQAAGAGGLVVMAQSSGGGADLKSAFGSILLLLMAVAFIYGTMTVIEGWNKKKRGEEGDMTIVAGLGMSLSPTLMYWIYSKMGLGGAAISTSDMGGF